MLYLDANIFINSLTHAHEPGLSCNAILDATEEGTLAALTATLTFDEVLWKLRSVMPYTDAIENILRFIDLPIKIVAVDLRIIREALDIARAHHLKPRDAIHAATMKVYTLTDICTSDKNFEAVSWLKRVPPEKAMK